jgi:hypothetical protein
MTVKEEIGRVKTRSLKTESCGTRLPFSIRERNLGVCGPGILANVY